MPKPLLIKRCSEEHMNKTIKYKITKYRRGTAVDLATAVSPSVFFAKNKGFVKKSIGGVANGKSN